MGKRKSAGVPKVCYTAKYYSTSVSEACLRRSVVEILQTVTRLEAASPVGCLQAITRLEARLAYFPMVVGTIEGAAMRLHCWSLFGR